MSTKHEAPLWESLVIVARCSKVQPPEYYDSLPTEKAAIAMQSTGMKDDHADVKAPIDAMIAGFSSVRVHESRQRKSARGGLRLPQRRAVAFE